GRPRRPAGVGIRLVGRLLREPGAGRRVVPHAVPPGLGGRRGDGGRRPGRAPIAWRRDPGWRWLVALWQLPPLNPEESTELLARAGVATCQRAHLAALGHGHPLALALLADVAAVGPVPAALADAPDLVTALLEVVW